MFRKLAFLVLSVFIIGMGLVVINTNIASPSGMESMIVLDNKAIAIEKNDQQNISITTNIEANEVFIESEAPVYQASNTQPTSSSTDVKKTVFDTTKYKNKNVSNESFFIPMTILYKYQLLPRSDNDIDTNHLRELAMSLPESDIPVILDLEHWNVHTEDDREANQNIDKYILVIDTMKKARPDLKFGYYGVLPNRDYWTPVSNSPRKVQEWHRINERLKRLAGYVDIVCPSLYTFYDDHNGWKKYALENIQRAREYGKPVYVFLWPQYHDSNRMLRGEFIASNVWLEQLQLMNNHADGIIIWGGFDLKKESYGKMYWDENAPWWQVTKKFITN